MMRKRQRNNPHQNMEHRERGEHHWTPHPSPSDSCSYYTYSPRTYINPDRAAHYRQERDAVHSEHYHHEKENSHNHYDYFNYKHEKPWDHFRPSTYEPMETGAYGDKYHQIDRELEVDSRWRGDKQAHPPYKRRQKPEEASGYDKPYRTHEYNSESRVNKRAYASISYEHQEAVGREPSPEMPSKAEYAEEILHKRRDEEEEERDNDDVSYKRGPRKDAEDLDQADKRPASKLIHVRNVDPYTDKDDLEAYVKQFGKVIQVCFLSKYHQALIEMDSVESANKAIAASKVVVLKRGKTVYFNYSKSQAIIPSKPRETIQSVNHIILCTILNPHFDITADAIHSITSKFGTVVRIVVFSKNNTPQALVEFENSSVASQAKNGLDGKDMYPGSCTLQISYAKAQRLNVTENTDTQRDYTNNSLPTRIAFGPAYPSSADEFHSLYPVNNAPSKCVLSVHGLDPIIMTHARIFNLLCVFGNVAKVKHISKEKGTLIQMCDNRGADAVISKLHNVKIFGDQLRIFYSGYKFVTDKSKGPAREEDGPHASDYTGSPLNRFSRNPTKQIVHSPTDTVYFSNTPDDFNETAMIRLFSRLQKDSGLILKQYIPAKLQTHIRIFGKKADKPTKTSGVSGLMKFDNMSAAAEAIAFANNERIGDCILRLSFSNFVVYN